MCQSVTSLADTDGVGLAHNRERKCADTIRGSSSPKYLGAWLPLFPPFISRPTNSVKVVKVLKAKAPIQSGAVLKR